MKSFSANDARTRFAEIMDLSRREPVAITKHGRTVNVLLATEDYERLSRLEDEWWMTHSLSTLPSKCDNLAIELAAQEVEKGDFIEADLIEC